MLVNKVGTVRKGSNFVVLEQTTPQLNDKRATIVHFNVFRKRMMATVEAKEEW